MRFSILLLFCWITLGDGVQHQVHLTVYKRTKPLKICGGAWISKNYILTSASCTKNADKIDVAWSSANVSTAITVRKESIKLHKNFNRNPSMNDISLVYLGGGVELQFSDSMRPAMLPPWKGKDFKRTNVIIPCSTRKARRNSSSSLAMAYRRANVVSNYECYYRYVIVQSSHICLSWKKDRAVAASCRIDMGSPVLFSDGSHSFVIGIVTFGGQPWRSGRPTLHQRVSSYSNWIQSETGAEV